MGAHLDSVAGGGGMKIDLDTPYTPPTPRPPPWWPGVRGGWGVSAPTGWGRGREGVQDVGVGGYQASRECAMQTRTAEVYETPAARGRPALSMGRRLESLYPVPPSAVKEST